MDAARRVRSMVPSGAALRKVQLVCGAVVAFLRGISREVVIALALAAFFGAPEGHACAQAVNRMPEGATLYTPSRLEWFAVELNAEQRVDLFFDRGFMMSFAGLEKENTLLIYVRYGPTVDREEMNKTINSAREIISMRAKSRGWSSWLRIREDVKLLDSK
jgi:hypothetical protein